MRQRETAVSWSDECFPPGNKLLKKVVDWEVSLTQRQYHQSAVNWLYRSDLWAYKTPWWRKESMKYCSKSNENVFTCRQKQTTMPHQVSSWRFIDTQWGTLICATRQWFCWEPVVLTGLCLYEHFMTYSDWDISYNVACPQLCNDAKLSDWLFMPLP